MQKAAQLLEQQLPSPCMPHTSLTQGLQLALSAAPTVHSSWVHVQGPSPQRGPPLLDEVLDELGQLKLQKASTCCMQA